MTEAEEQVMHQHQAFWPGPLAEGRGVVRAQNRVEVIEYGKVDSAVASGLMTFETFQIMGGRTG